MIRVADRDGSGTVELNEFMKMMCEATEVSILIIKTVCSIAEPEPFFFARS